MNKLSPDVPQSVRISAIKTALYYSALTHSFLRPNDEKIFKPFGADIVEAANRVFAIKKVRPTSGKVTVYINYPNGTCSSRTYNVG